MAPIRTWSPLRMTRNRAGSDEEPGHETNVAEGFSLAQVDAGVASTVMLSRGGRKDGGGGGREHLAAGALRGRRLPRPRFLREERDHPVQARSPLRMTIACRGCGWR